MAKKDKMAGGMKMPKRVAGVKLPKELRQAGDALIAKANSPEGRAAIARGLTLAAGAATAAVAAQREAGTGATPHRAETGTDEGPTKARTSPDAAAMAAAIGGVATVALSRFFAAKKA